MQTFLIATTNPGKVQEIQDLFQAKQLHTLGLSEVRDVANIEVEETGETFAENAALKAKVYGRMSGLITLADDSGLSVEALEGRPGVYSKRYGTTDSERITKLLEEMRDIPEGSRQAWFTCNMAIYDPSSDKMYQVEGRVDGAILQEPVGSNGFGYDPIFYCPAIQKSFGDCTREEKNQVSHRGIALQGIREIIRKRFV